MQYFFVFFLSIITISIATAGIQIEYNITHTKDHPLVNTEELLPTRLVLSVDGHHAKIEKKFSKGSSTKLNLYYTKNENVYIAELWEKVIITNPDEIYNPSIGSLDGGDNFEFTTEGIKNLKTTYPLIKDNYDIQHLDKVAQTDFLGYPCKRALGKLNDYKIEILYTEALGHQFFQFGNLNGITLMFEIQHPIFEEVIYTATSVKDMDFDRSFFKTPKINSDFNNVYSDNKLINSTAKNIKVRNLDNNKIELDFNTNKITVLNIWSMRYLVNQAAIEKLNKLRMIYKDDDRVQFISIVRERPKYLRFFVKAHEMKYQTFGSGHQAIRRYDADILPANVVIAPGGKIVFHQTHYWPTTAFQLDSIIEKLLNNHFATVEQ